MGQHEAGALGGGAGSAPTGSLVFSMKRLFCPRRANQRCGQKEPIFGTAYSQTPVPRLTGTGGPWAFWPRGLDQWEGPETLFVAWSWLH